MDPPTTGRVDNQSDTEAMEYNLSTPAPLMPAGMTSNWPSSHRFTLHHLRVILIFLIFPEELEEGAEVEEAEMTHLSYISKGNGYLGYLTVSPPSSLVLF